MNSVLEARAENWVEGCLGNLGQGSGLGLRVASNQAQPLLIWRRRDLGLGASKNKRALIGQFKGKIPSRREVPSPEGRRATTPKWRRDVQREENATSIRHLLLCARRFLHPNEKNGFQT